MELFAEVVSVVGAMLLSVSCGLLLENCCSVAWFGSSSRRVRAPSRFAPKPAGPEANRMESR